MAQPEVQDLSGTKIGAQSMPYSNYVVPVVANYIHTHPGLIFQQDNAGGHSARSIYRQFEELGVPLLKWPAYSPNPSPIEAL
jgi:hypothetical protein